MPLSKVNRPGLNTGVTDNSDATAVTIDSSERVGLGAAPAKKLTVDGDADFNVALRSASTRTGIGFYTPGTGSLGNPAGSMLLLSDNTFRMGTASVYGLIMDQSGRVTMPYQPSFTASQSTTLQNSATTVTYGQDFDIGNNYDPSNGRFTAPVSGVYFFMCSIQAHGTTHQTYTSIVFLKNGVQYGPSEFVNTWAGGADHTTTQGALAMQMSAGDYATVYAQRGHRGIQGAFTGFLIG